MFFSTYFDFIVAGGIRNFYLIILSNVHCKQIYSQLAWI